MGNLPSVFSREKKEDHGDCEDGECEDGADDSLLDQEDLENPTLPDGLERHDLFVIPMPDPTQIREILAKGAPAHISGSSYDDDETKAASQAEGAVR